jgi:hypothetical protein
MKRLIAVLALSAVFGCSSKSAPAPEISNFTMTSPVTAPATTLKGSLDVSDPDGLVGFSLNITVTGGGATSKLTQPVPGGTTAMTEATVPLELLIGSTGLPAGTYTVTVTPTEENETGNSLSATVTVQ